MAQAASSTNNLPAFELAESNWDTPLPLGPPGILHGKLRNGLTYYVRKSNKPKERAALRLAVGVGSVVEEEEEQGVAHIVEHLAFNATKKYENHELVSFLESLGVEFGPHQNATTSMDSTIFQLMIPTNDASVVTQSLAVLGEWAFNIRCAPGDLEKERGPVLEEWRQGRSAAGRISEAQIKLLLQKSRYSERLPIGKEDVIRNVTADTVRAFFGRWYQPCNMALVAVGDFQDCAVVVDQIRDHLDVIPAHHEDPPRPRLSYGFQPHDTPVFGVLVDPEQQQATVIVSIKQPPLGYATAADYLVWLRMRALNFVLNRRLFRLARKLQPPFFNASGGVEKIVAGCEVVSLAATCAPHQLLEALSSLLTEMARLRLYGITERELRIAKADLQAGIEQMWTERDQGYADDLADEYVRHFLEGELAVGEECEVRMAKTMMDKVTQESILPLAAQLSVHNSCVIKVMHHQQVCREADLEAVVQQVQHDEERGLILPWEENNLQDRILDKDPEPGSIVEEVALEQLGATQWTLSNGMTVCFKTTTFLEDQVLLAAVATGGLTEFPRAAFRSASMASIIAQELGEFGISPIDLQELLAGKRVEVATREGAFYRSVGGEQSPADLEVAFQLLHRLFMHQVVPVESELTTIMKVIEDSILGQLRNPVNRYHSEVRYINYGRCYYFEPPTLRSVRQVQPDKCCSIFNQLFSNPASFSLCIVGNTSTETLRSLVEKYMASIEPGRGSSKLQPSHVAPLPFTLPSRPVIRDIPMPLVEPISQVTITFPVELHRETALSEMVWLRLCCKLLETRAIQQLRFKTGKIYSMAVTPFFGCEAPSREETLRGDVQVSFSCAPEERLDLSQMVLRELQRLLDEACSSEEVDTLLRLELREFEELQHENTYWLDLLTSGYLSRRLEVAGRTVDDVYVLRLDARSSVLQGCTPATLRLAFRRLFPCPCTSRYSQLMMVPRPPLLQQLANAAARLLPAKPTSAALFLLLAAGTITAAALAIRYRPARTGAGWWRVL